jgi:O-antigen/teichoic acid export membrane protein
MLDVLRKLSKKKVVQNFSYLTISSVFSQLISLLTVVKISRIFAPEEYGIYTFIFAQSQLINVVGDLGMRKIIIRAISRDISRTNDLIYNGLKLRVLASIFLIFIYLTYNYFLGSLNNVQISILFLFSITGIFSNLFENAFLGQQKMLLPSLFNMGFSILWAIIIFTLPSVYFSVIILLSIQLVNGAAKSGILYTIMLKQRILVGQVNNFFTSSKVILKESWPYFLLFLVMLPTVYLTNNFLDINSTKAEIGYFNLSQKLMGPVSLVISIALTAIFPNFSSLWVNDEKKFYQIISVGFKYFLLFAAFLCFLFTLFSREVVLLLFTESYLPAIKVCQLQVWYIFLMGVNSLIGTIWGATNKEKLILKTAVVNAILSTPILYFGSYYGALGLSYGYVISFAIFEIYIWRVFIKSEKIVINDDWILWIIAILLFFTSYYFPVNISIVYRLFTAAIILTLFSLYVYAKYKSVTISTVEAK